MSLPLDRIILRILVVVAFAYVLTACETTPRNPEQPVVPEKHTVRIQESLLAPCPPLPRPPAPGPSGRLQEGQVVEWVSNMVGVWEVCSVSKASLTQTIRDAFNIQPLETKP